ncbi:SRPBCC family protein [Mucilaginibacter dorajii]|uniref:SRPBCC domain-containing protein n=1 Tax=Mucilaginibacter dorajii TaxID=692994 RepID=A0ABP7Q1W5_9SPHI|nr:SRPBCC domain-containing protein [Mucilaginibacter dorajii]MCS3732800.1 hypothetical protein [Mucilaginibacter dorajii]
MDKQDFSTTFLVDQTPMEVFDAINDIGGWWTENFEGGSQKLNDEYSVRFGDVHYSKQKLIEVIPGEKVVWLITDSKLTFVEHQTEWTGTKVSFEISKQGDKTQVHFTHHGLVPRFECFNGCSKGWEQYAQHSLHSFITTGKGMPAKKGA